MSAQKRSRRYLRSKKYTKLDMGHSAPSTAASPCPIMTITTSTATLSAPAPSGLPSTSNILSVPKPPAERPACKTWAICHPAPALISSAIHSDWSSDKDWESTKQKERERTNKIMRRENRKVAQEESRQKTTERTF